jgi:hypothetical protein
MVDEEVHHPGDETVSDNQSGMNQGEREIRIRTTL